MKSILILFDSVVTLYIWILIINAVISWLVAFNILNTGNRFVYSVLDFSYRLTSPALNSIRRFLPNFGSIDISPVILILALMFLRNFVFEMFAPSLFLVMIIDGKKEAEILRQDIKKEIDSLKSKNSKVPGLTVILVGDFAPSQIYVKNKEKSAKEVGINSNVVRYSKEVTEEEVLKKIEELNNDADVSGILVQLPLPPQINKEKIINAVSPKKDVDGFHPMNVGNLSSGYRCLVPCTPLGCLYLIKKVEKNLSGKNAVIIGRSNLNGKPMAQLLLKENCTVTIVHSKTKDLKTECLKADILVAAVGVPNLVKSDWVKKDSIVIDVGINKVGDKIVGDVEFETVKEKAKAITPVPGGVGPMTIACLLKNTLECFKGR
jgi:methylenetetrahydrofolate dehydrogenase (NADP+)/methenyltetrahydrofolate cyclohydrolase